MIVPTQKGQLYDEIVSRWPALAISALVLAASLIFKSLLKRRALSNIPVVGPGQKEFMEKGGWEFYVEGYKKVSPNPDEDHGIWYNLLLNSSRKAFLGSQHHEVGNLALAGRIL